MTVQEAIDLIKQVPLYRYECELEKGRQSDLFKALYLSIEALEKQIPKKIEYGTDNSWGVNKKAPVCPICDYFLTQTYFIGDGEKTTYCDHCGQKIDWSDWSEEE